jgi:hypothetical protein
VTDWFETGVADVISMAHWVAGALTRSGYRADFSVSSLREVDRFFDEQSADGRPVDGGLLASDTDARIFALGAYVGEVLRREAGGTWHADSGSSDGALGLSVVLPDQTVVWPVMRTWKRYHEGSENSLAAYGAALALDVQDGLAGLPVLITRTCTTGWGDWVHGELWSWPSALARVRLPLGHTLGSSAGKPAGPHPTRLSPEEVRAGHRRNRYLPLDDVARAALHRGVMNDRLGVTMRDGSRHKLLWLRTDSAFEILQERLSAALSDRLTLD